MSPFFHVTIKNQSEGDVKFYFVLQASEGVDVADSGARIHVALSQIQQAAIATLKEALVRDLEVTCEGQNKSFQGGRNPGNPGMKAWNHLMTVTLHAS